MREPNFDNMLKVLRREKPERPTLFEFIISPEKLKPLIGDAWVPEGAPDAVMRNYISAFFRAGYDFCTLPPWSVGFAGFTVPRAHGQSVGMSHGGVIHDRESFNNYNWPDADAVDYDRIFETASKYVPEGGKIIAFGWGGVEENMIKLVGYEDLCLLMLDDPELVADIATRIGETYLKHYQHCLRYDIVGAGMANDDWGFKTQLLFSPNQMREFILPWHRKIAEAIHAAGRPAILHSCGQLEMVWDEIIDDLKYDAKHSYEDVILPVEDAYEKYGPRIAILGGMDLDFLCSSTPDQIYRRCMAMRRAALEG